MNYIRLRAGRNNPCPCGQRDVKDRRIKFKKCCGKLADRRGAPVEIELLAGTYEYIDAQTGTSSTYIVREGHGEYHGHREDIQKDKSRTHTGLRLAGLLSVLDPRLEGVHSILKQADRKRRP